MQLSKELISKFVKITNDQQSTGGTTLYGTVINNGDELGVRLDGSDNVVPVERAADIKTNDRVMVRIDNHIATVIGNVSSPAARLDDVEEIRKLAVGEIDAGRINVDDLGAIGATIGGFNLTDSSIYSGEKDSIESENQGIYLDKDGQMVIGGQDNHLKYYKDQNGVFKLDIEVDEVVLKETGKLSESLNDIQTDIDNVRDEITSLLVIESSQGILFKNNQVSTVLSVIIYHGKERITDADRMREVYGNTAYLQWKWQRLGEEEFGTILSTDSRIGADGFIFTLSPDDVDVKVTFMCELITD